MRVDEQMTKNVATCKTGDSLARAAKQLWDCDCGSMPVVDDRRRVLGMITDRDICMAALTTGKSLADLRVRDAMAKDVASMRPSESVREAELVMRARGVRRLPVLDDQNRLIGLLCCNDLVRWVDDGGANGTTVQDAVHLLRTLATVGRPRTATPGSSQPAARELAVHSHPSPPGYGSLRAIPPSGRPFASDGEAPPK